MKDTENMVEQRNADVRTVGWSLRQKELLGIVLDAIHSLRPSARNTHDPRRPKTNWSFASFLSTPFLLDNARALACAHEGHIVAKWNACEFDFFRCRLCDSRRVVYKQRCGWRTKRVRSEFLHSNREGVERFDVWKKRDAQGSLRWMWKGMWSSLQTWPKQTRLLPRVLV